MRRTNEELIEEYISGNTSAMDELYRINIGLIISAAKSAFEYSDSPEFIDYDDLNQEAALAFLLSAPKYEKLSGVKFSTYIYECVFNYAVDYISKTARRAVNDKVIYSKNSFCDDIDPDRESYAETNIILQDYWQKKFEICTISAEQAFFINYFRETIKNAVENLNPRQKKVISFRYGFGEKEYENPHTFAETAKRFGIAESDIRSIEKSAFSEMRKYCSERLSGEFSIESGNNIYSNIFKTHKVEKFEIENYGLQTEFEKPELL